MPTREARWTNPSHPQTLQIAVFLLYAKVFFFVFDLLRARASGYRVDLMAAFPWSQLYFAMIIGALLAGRGIASGAKWGYLLGVGVALAPFVLRILIFRTVEATYGIPVINLMFEVALVALLVHPESRNYQRIWFD